MNRRRRALRAALVVALVLLPAGGAVGESSAPAPRQSRPQPQQLAQACRTLCVEEFNACQRACDTAATRIDCQAQCQTRFNLCTSACP